MKKYLAASADANVTVCVQVIVHAVLPEPVVVVLAADPVQEFDVVPTAAALARLVLQLLMSVATAANTLMVCPAVGADLEVMVVPVWLPILASVLTKLAQFVAVTIPLTLTVLRALCPQPLSVEPVLQMLLMFGLPVLTKPLKSDA